MKPKRYLLIPLLIAAAALVAWAAYTHWPGRSRPLGASVTGALGGSADIAGYARAERPRALSFPADFGAHDDFQTEWWYYTGNLATSTGEHFGYQLTIFRRALLPPGQQPGRASDWGSAQVYMAHLALTDVSGGQHYAYQRYERGAAGLAGATASPYHVWIDGWSIEESADGASSGGASAGSASSGSAAGGSLSGDSATTGGTSTGGIIRLSATEGDISLDLDLRNLKGPVLQGDHGYSRKGPEPGNASYYYSLTRIATAGQITVRGRSYHVDGLSWMDHEFSTSALSAGEVGWDWFSIQLSDGRELMLVQIREAGGAPSPFSAGTLVDADGAVHPLGKDDFSISISSHWRSPHTGAVYPAGWQVRIPSANLDLAVSPYLPDQEMNVGYSYWEGAVKIAGPAAAGSGYVELTGYAPSTPGQF